VQDAGELPNSRLDRKVEKAGTCQRKAANIIQKMTLLTAIICTYNRADSLKRTLDSFRNQEALECEEAWELLVVDNNSSDHTRQVVKSFVATAKMNVRYIFEPRQGKSYALNTGIANSNGQILAFTDDDVIVDKRWVASIIEAGSRYPHEAFGGKVLPLWPDYIPPWIQANGPYSRPIVGGPIPSHDRGDEVREYGEGMWVPIGCNMFFRREVFDKYGGFRTDLGPHGDIYGTNEDCEIGFRLINNGERLLYYPKAIIYHPVPRSRLSQEYVLRYLWSAGITQARMNSPSNILGRSKRIIKCILLIVERSLKYLFSLSNSDLSIRMHHKCFLYYLKGQIYFYTIGMNDTK